MASGQITNSDLSRIDLVQSSEHTVVEIAWLNQLTVVEPGQLQAVTARAGKILAAAVVELAARRREGA